uniref:ERCC4 domain-containing protein n=1 Tax=viral metagenome TaxID=1070528 RepID=A0A6C0BS46_9ZZZZ
MQIISDCRENSLLTQLHAQNEFYDLSLNITSKNLHLGDIIISDISENPIVIFERKTLYDLASSIKDGRFKEQSERLINSNSLNNHNICYLIEGSMNSYNEKKGRMEKRALWSALTDLNYFKGFSIFSTVDTRQTAEFILRYCDKLSREFKKGKLTYEQVTYSDTVKSVKKENITKENIHIIMLNQIPGISSKISKAIMDHCGNLQKLIDICNTNKEELFELCTTDKNDKKRKINKTTIEKLINFLI